MQQYTPIQNLAQFVFEKKFILLFSKDTLKS